MYQKRSEQKKREQRLSGVHVTGPVDVTFLAQPQGSFFVAHRGVDIFYPMPGIRYWLGKIGLEQITFFLLNFIFQFKHRKPKNCRK